MTLELVHHLLQLARELLLSWAVGKNGDTVAGGVGFRLQGARRRHVLDHKDSDLVTRTIEEVRLNFNLSPISFKLNDMPAYTNSRASAAC